MIITVNTTEGPATITTRGEWGQLAPIEVDGQGAGIARGWLEITPGAFGNFIGAYGSPEDIHCAALLLQETPRPEIQVQSIEGEVQPYGSRVQAGAVT